MEYDEHGGPVYALHRVFTLTDVDWPRLETREEEQTAVPLVPGEGNGELSASR
ncbi:MAG TPA: hypothetical protein VMF52_09000 [Steroidobacteraceae bacterium]|nr:hypothetical protein [Steroidobacteraceae bacterium]